MTEWYSPDCPIGPADLRVLPHHLLDSARDLIAGVVFERDRVADEELSLHPLRVQCALELNLLNDVIVQGKQLLYCESAIDIALDVFYSVVHVLFPG